MNSLGNKLTNLISSRKTRKYWILMITMMAGVVVFFTTYALILPAITLEQETAEEMAGIDFVADSVRGGSGAGK